MPGERTLAHAASIFSGYRFHAKAEVGELFQKTVGAGMIVCERRCLA